MSVARQEKATHLNRCANLIAKNTVHNSYIYTSNLYLAKNSILLQEEECATKIMVAITALTHVVYNNYLL